MCLRLPVLLWVARMILLVEIVNLVGIPFVEIGAGDRDFDNQAKQETAASLTDFQGTLSRVPCQPCIILKFSQCSVVLWFAWLLMMISRCLAVCCGFRHFTVNLCFTASFISRISQSSQTRKERQ